MIKVLNLASHATIMAVKPRPPAVLVEMGYLTNPYDAALLSSDPQSFARGIYSGILDYLNIP